MVSETVYTCNYVTMMTCTASQEVMHVKDHPTQRGTDHITIYRIDEIRKTCQSKYRERSLIIEQNLSQNENI